MTTTSYVNVTPHSDKVLLKILTPSVVLDLTIPDPFGALPGAHMKAGAVKIVSMAVDVECRRVAGVDTERLEGFADALAEEIRDRMRIMMLTATRDALARTVNSGPLLLHQQNEIVTYSEKEIGPRVSEATRSTRPISTSSSASASRSTSST